MFIDTLLTRSFGPDIRRRYLAAIDVHSRVETDSMMKMMRQMSSLVRTQQTLSNVVDVDLLNSTTSISGDIYNAIRNIVQRTHDSVEQFRTRLLQPFTNTYEKKVDFFVRRIVDQANAFLAYQASSDNGTFTNIDVNSSAMIFCQYYGNFWTWFKDDYRDQFKASTFFDQKMCSRWLIDMCEKFPRYTEYEEKKMPEETKVWLKCMTEFRRFLDDADAWVKAQATLNSSLPLSTTSDDDALAKMRNNTKHLMRTTDNFRLHHVTKVWANAIENCFVC